MRLSDLAKHAAVGVRMGTTGLHFPPSPPAKPLSTTETRYCLECGARLRSSQARSVCNPCWEKAEDAISEALVPKQPDLPPEPVPDKPKLGDDVLVLRFFGVALQGEYSAYLHRDGDSILIPIPAWVQLRRRQTEISLEFVARRGIVKIPPAHADIHGRWVEKYGTSFWSVPVDCCRIHSCTLPAFRGRNRMRCTKEI